MRIRSSPGSRRGINSVGSRWPALLHPDVHPRVLIALGGVFAILVVATVVLWLLGRWKPGLRLDEVRLRVRTWWVMAGVFTTATSTILLRTGTGPRWLALVGSVVAVVMVLDGQRVEPWVVLAFPTWVLALSLYILAANFRRKQTGLDANTWPLAPAADADRPSRL